VSKRGRGRAVKAAPAFRQSPGGVTYTTAQVAQMLEAQQRLSAGNARANQMPDSPYWETSPFGPGRRLPPAPINVPRDDSGRPEPRLWEYPVSWNLQIDDAWHVPWDVLRRAADMPLFRKCIERRKSVCELDYVVTVDPVAVAMESMLSGAAKKDVESELRQKYLGDIARVTDWLRVPDRKNDMEWPDWASLLMENRMKYDAAVVYPRKTYGGDLFALEIIDGRTIKPLLDEYGGRPMAPYPAFQQIMYGFPRGEFTATVDPGMIDPTTGRPLVPGGYPGDTLYYRKSVWRSESPYGMSPTEIALLDGLLWMRRMGWMMAEYTEGVMPVGLLETEPNDWTPTQWADWSRALNDHLSGNTAERHRWPLLPGGVKFVQGEEVAEKYRPDYDMFLIKLVTGDFGLPASEVGFTEAGALGASFHEGESDILERNIRQPDAKWLARYATKLAIRELGMPQTLKVQILGLESEDEAAADAVALARLQNGRMTLNEDRATRGEPPYSFAEADMPVLLTTRGMVFIEGASATAPPGTLVSPAQAPPPGGAPPGGQVGQPDDADEQDDTDEQDGKGSPAAKSLELAALRKWLARHPSPPRPFDCKALTAADAPHLAADSRVVFKAAEPGPKALSGPGPAGRGTSS
jgi:hypothetical protein